MSKRLSHEEEILLLRDRDNKRSLDKLVIANMGLVHKLVHKFPMKTSSYSYDDLFQEGIAGLIHGIKKFEIKRGYRLSTYVYRWIQAYITRYYQNHGRTIRVPVHMSTKQGHLNKMTELLTQELGRTPTSEELDEVVEGSEEIKASMMTSVSLNQLVSESDELESLQGEDNTDELDRKADCEMLLDKVKTQVSERDFSILVKRFGLFGETPHSLSELAELNGLTRARCHQVEKEMIVKMRDLSR